MSAAVQKQVIPKFIPKPFHRWLGNDRLFKCLIPLERYTLVRYFNSVYNTAPLFKWSLSVVPLYSIFAESKPVDKLDVNSSVALFSTGFVWTFYSLMIQPQNSGSRSLALVNLCLACVHGYNCFRILSYNLEQGKLAKKNK
ncbi:unnamed protein product [Phytomonas sp. Hart1]|nr:unnamed protein product [Phytomonas sp. Hart1]|eukprot:CCW67845.1 unnamed protein product [Phytomonas sp. isolate Hart1]